MAFATTLAHLRKSRCILTGSDSSETRFVNYLKQRYSLSKRVHANSVKARGRNQEWREMRHETKCAARSIWSQCFLLFPFALVRVGGAGFNEFTLSSDPLPNRFAKLGIPQGILDSADPVLAALDLVEVVPVHIGQGRASVYRRNRRRGYH